MKMLALAPYNAPKKKTNKDVKKTRDDLRRHGTLGTIPDGSNVRSASEEDEEEEEDKYPVGEERRG